MQLWKMIKRINNYFNKLDDNIPYIGDIIPNNWKQVRKFLIILISIILCLAIFTIVLSFII